MRTTLHLMVALALAWAAPTPASAQAEARGRAEDSCVICHRQTDDETLREPVTLFEDDVHAAAGLGCQDCHGGDPDPERADDIDAMAPETGFRPAPGRLEVSDFCGRCHADPDYMRQYDPQARVDQLAEYRTSVHGLRNAEGDETPATCIDCHGTHGIRPVGRPDSPVYATNVPRTCAECHAKEGTMAAYGLATNQYGEWRRSVHAVALLEMGDIAAPACNDCHGNHGAAPPGVASVANVCGHCHAREGALFRESFKKDLFAEMEVSECIVCHGNHRVVHPTPELFRSESEPSVSQGRITAFDPFGADLGDLDVGARAELTWYGVIAHFASEREEAPLLHRIEVAAEGSDPLVFDATIRPGAREDLLLAAESAELSARLEAQPVSGVPVRAGDAVRFHLALEASESAFGVQVRTQTGRALHVIERSVCLTCHTRGDECDQATEVMYSALSSMDRGLRGAAQLLHEAEVAGMEVSEPLFELNSRGRTALIEARALIHSFDTERLLGRSEEGKELATELMATGEAALDELSNRHRGLAISLVLVALVLLALFLKIRQVDRDREEARQASAASGE
jgi:hypothetical protein